MKQNNIINHALKMIGIVLAILVYTVSGFAYLHNTFSSKEVMQMICDRLDRIENKVDRLLE